MKTITISRMEGIYAICEDKNQKYYAIEIAELPKGAKVGDVLIVDDVEGTLTIHEKETAGNKKQKS